MIVPRRRPLAGLPLSLIASAVLIVTACGSAATLAPTPSRPAEGSPTPGGSASASPTPAAHLLLRVTSEGGFIGPAASLAAIPEVSVYADGRIMSPAPIDSLFPAPLLPAVAIRDVGPDGAATIIAAIRDAGLDHASQGDAGGGIPGDLGTTVFAVNVDGSLVTTRLVLSGGGPGIPGGLASPAPEAAAAKSLLDRLTDPTETWGSTSVRSSTLAPTAYRVFVAPGAPGGDGGSSEPAIAWPLSVPLDQFGAVAVPDRGIPGLRQGAALGADAAVLGPVLASANSQTAFISGGNLYTLYVRPLLPDEVPDQG
jgi:hypothetical protein